MDEVIQFLKAALTPVTAVTAVIGCWIAIRQYQTKQLELRLARYDKRFKVYQALKDFISAVISERKIPANAVREFDIATNEASFLFEDDICEYLALVRKRAEEMNNLNSQIEELLANRERNPDRTRLVEEKTKLADWFFDEFKASKKKFERYLSVKDKSSSCCSCESERKESK
jgi:signal transduction histidine kinase